LYFIVLALSSFLVLLSYLNEPAQFHLGRTPAPFRITAATARMQLSRKH